MVSDMVTKLGMKSGVYNKISCKNTNTTVYPYEKWKD